MRSRAIFRSSVLITVFLLSFCAPALAEEFSANVVAVKDGDTIEVMHEGKAVCTSHGRRSCRWRSTLPGTLPGSCLCGTSRITVTS